ncbi:hypothetical protein Malapachy_2655 [Malassezia pachydermatis]|uniref:Uncharacterized protein n=1 Tax=Malassezia pachydermatis TaxID=77020 RepID=A0A0M8MRB0_9BASI|nr:hypothetical protein Malapachy_2655 [Malassezia pachydermatis]KOS15227.1 hypothetical protein Malapachy_2655 [Malassezia pachydermatis]
MNLGDQAAAPGQSEAAMPDWKFRARTLVRNFMARTRDSFEDEPEWESLTDLMTELKRTIWGVRRPAPLTQHSVAGPVVTYSARAAVDFTPSPQAPPTPSVTARQR